MDHQVLPALKEYQDTMANQENEDLMAKKEIG
jgi:hypothetical protein